jgi:hypothetical protein
MTAGVECGRDYILPPGGSAESSESAESSFALVAFSEVSANLVNPDCFGSLRALFRGLLCAATARSHRPKSDGWTAAASRCGMQRD